VALSQIQQCKWSSDGSKVVIAAEGHAVGIIRTSDWTVLWENWGNDATARQASERSLLLTLPDPLAPRNRKTAKGKAKGRQGMKRGRTRLVTRLTTTAEEEMEPLDVVWGPGDETVVVGGRFNVLTPPFSHFRNFSFLPPSMACSYVCYLFIYVVYYNIFVCLDICT
jgi:hypothetical protein